MIKRMLYIFYYIKHLMNVETELKSLYEILNNKKNTHPTISNFWINYLDIKFNNLKKNIEECKNVINSINDDDDDIDLNALIFAYSYASSLRSNSSEIV